MNINEIATMAAKIKKPNKAEAFDIVRAMVVSLGTDEEADKKGLSMLYSFFIARVTKPKTLEQWVSKAMGKNDPRFYLNYCYSDGERYIATDGHRVHWMPTDKPKGYYDSMGNSVDVDAKYPDIAPLIPKGRAKKMDNDIKSVESTSNTLADNICGETYVNHKYLKEALSFDQDAKVYNADKNSIVRLDFGNDRHAMIMPIRV